MDWIDIYKQKLYDTNSSYSEISNFITAHKPTTLYRYRVFGEHWRDEVFNGQVYMSSACMFNDPFDSMCYIDYDQYFKYKNIQVIKLIEKNNLKRIFDKLVKNIEMNFQNYVKIASFSEKKDSILMWSHYSAFHSGFCIQYDLTKVINKILFLPVVYEQERYEASKCLAFHDKNNALNPALFKAPDWSYEKEWRMLATKNDLVNTNCIYLNEAITGIYLGVKCENYMATNEIKEWAKENQVAVYKMRMSNTRYELFADKI